LNSRLDQGAPPGMGMDFIGGRDPPRIIKYHGFAPIPPQKFHRDIFTPRVENNKGLLQVG